MRFRFSYKETAATILTESEEFYKIAVKAILEARNEIEAHINKNPLFLLSLEPLNCSSCEKCGKIIRRMCEAAKIAGVGPMASVAGAIAQYAVEKMLEAGAKLSVVENGGDVAIATNREIRVGIYPSKFAFLIPAGEKLAICTSSGKIGPSISFGFADAATIVADDAAVADALATALGNIIKEEFGKEEIEKAVAEFYNAKSKNIRGAMVIKDDIVAVAGKIPKLIVIE